MKTEAMGFIFCKQLAYCALLCVLCTSAASADFLERIQAGIEGVARGMDYVGQRTGELIGPGMPLADEAGAAFEYRRVFEENYPTGSSPLIALSSEFGDIQVTTWDERVVRVRAEIVAGAASESAAEQLANLVEIRVAHGEDYLECRTVYPEIKSSSEIAWSVNYTLHVPRDAGIVVDTFFGDVSLSDIGGMLVADVQYGALTLGNIHGSARARVQGNFPVQVHGLHQGGEFKFQGAVAEFHDVRGDLNVDHFRGATTITGLAEDVRLTIQCDTAKARVVLAPDMMPDLSAVIVYGRLESDLDVSRTLRGAQLVARHPNAEARQHIDINASFSDVIIAVEGKEHEHAVGAGERKAFTDTQLETVALDAHTAIELRAIPGNIRVEGVDAEEIRIEATRVVWAPSAAAGMDALDALQLHLAPTDDVLQVETRLTQDVAGFYGTEDYRMDMHIRLPRELSLHIAAEAGTTAIEGMGAGVRLEQQQGDVVLEHIKDAVHVRNEAGSIELRACSGPVELEARHGAIRVEQVYGDVRASAEEGAIHVDGPQGNVFIRQRNGDVRLLCLEPIKGDLDILVERGDLNVFIAPDSHATINVKATNGRVQSALSLSGSINRDVQEFFGRINDGTYTVRLESREGDIFLN